MPNREFHFWVYILSSRSRNLYVGMTNKLWTRTSHHKEHRPGAHTAKYNIDRLVYYEYFQYVRNAIAREKELKRWSRSDKGALIEKTNPTWEDLYVRMHEEWEVRWGKQIPFGDDKQEKQTRPVTSAKIIR